MRIRHFYPNPDAEKDIMRLSERTHRLPPFFCWLPMTSYLHYYPQKSSQAATIVQNHYHHGDTEGTENRMILLFNLSVLRVSVVNKQGCVVLPVWVAAKPAPGSSVFILVTASAFIVTCRVDPPCLENRRAGQHNGFGCGAAALGLFVFILVSATAFGFDRIIS